jgi:hypothetical protein
MEDEIGLSMKARTIESTGLKGNGTRLGGKKKYTTEKRTQNKITEL